MKKLVFKLLGSSEQKWAKAIVGVLIIGAFAFIFGPNIYAQFALQGGGTGYGYGYGYGVGYGVNDGSYRTGGGNLDQYAYGYGFADTYSWTYNDFGTCTVTCGGGTQSKSETACKNSNGDTVANSYCDSGTDTVTQSCNTQACSSGGGGGSYNASTCTSVVYGDYAAACFAGYQYRNITSRTPDNCTMTAAQQDAAKKLCGAEVPNVDINGNGLINYQDANNTANFIALEKNLVKKINKALSHRLSGRILLQVEEKGEAWYVYPINELRYYLGRPADAFAIMRKLGLGVSEKDYSNFAKGTVPARLAGRILLRVHANGEAYYVNPLTMKMSYLGRPADAFALMRKFGLGISNANLHQIGIGEIK